MNKRLLILILSALFWSPFLLVKAQPGFAFQASAGSYVSLTSGTSPTLVPSTTGTNLNDGYSNIIPIGFPFSYNNVTYNTLGISTNGFAYLSNTGLSFTVNTTNNDLATGLSTVRPMLAPFWDDLRINNTTDIVYQVTGTAPNRVFTTEWKNVFWFRTATQASISFQLKFYETSNIIEYHYQNLSGAIENTTAGFGASIGLTNSTTGNNSFLSLSNSTLSPIVSSTTSINTITSFPSSGTIYRFSPLTACSGLPTGTVANANISTVCSGTHFNVSLSNLPVATGLTFQWQSSPAGAATWSNITGANTSTSTVSQTVATDYRCLVTCTASNQTAASSIVTINMETANCSVANDECLQAEVLTQSNYITGSTGNAFSTANASTSTPLSNNLGAAGDDDIWFSFTATSRNAVVKFSSTLAKSGNTGSIMVVLYSGINCNTNTEVEAKVTPIIDSTGEVLFWGLTLGNTYFLRVGTVGTSWRAAGRIAVMQPAIFNGSLNNCNSLVIPPIDNTNNNTWLPIYNGTTLAGEINVQGNFIGTINAALFNTTGVRQFAANNRYYLSRNITLTSSSNLTGNYLLRFFASNTEIDNLIQQPSSNINSLNTIQATLVAENCTTAGYTGGGILLAPTATGVYNNTHSFIDFTANSLASYYLHGDAVVLPLQNFLVSATRTTQQVSLQWVFKATTNNIASFVIEKSTNGNVFVRTGAIDYQNNKNNYAYTDFLVNDNATYYYRIVARLKDGSVLYSTIIKVDGRTDNIVQVYPNPFKQQVSISVYSSYSATAQCIITDVTGKPMYRTSVVLQAGQNNWLINPLHIPTGVYVLQLVDSNGRSMAHQKIIKQ